MFFADLLWCLTIARSLHGFSLCFDSELSLEEYRSSRSLYVCFFNVVLRRIVVMSSSTCVFRFSGFTELAPDEALCLFVCLRERS
jgi:hypothetical protein